MYHVGGNLLLNLTQMAPLIIRKKMGLNLLRNWLRSNSNMYMRFFKMMLCCSCLCVVFLSVWNTVIIKEAALKGTISLGDQDKRENMKSRSEEKVVGFSSSSLFPARKRNAVTQGVTRGIDHQTQRRTQGAGIVKGWEDKRGYLFIYFLHENPFLPLRDRRA